MLIKNYKVIFYLKKFLFSQTLLRKALQKNYLILFNFKENKVISDKENL
jgi:hypothetical protein